MRFRSLPLVLTFLIMTACNSRGLPPAPVIVAPAASPGPVEASATGAPGDLIGETPKDEAVTVATAQASTPSAIFTAPAAATRPVALAGGGATVAPAITPLVTVPPSATPTLTPAPTAIVPPAARLQRGRWLQEIGDCDSARREFAGVVEAAGATAGAVKPAELSEARYRLSQCYLRDDADAEAATVLADLLATAPDGDIYRAPATFLLGEAQTALRSWDEAVASYTRYLALAPDVACFTWQRIASVRTTVGNLAGAAEAYTNALNASPDWSNTVAIRRALARVLLRQNNGQAAAAQYDTLRGDQTSGAWAAEMQWLAGSALDQAGDKAGAAQRWQIAAQADPTTNSAHQSIVALIDAGEPVDDFLRGKIDYYNDAFALAVEAFGRVRAADPGGHAGEAWYYTGLSYLSLGQFDKAIAELGNFIAAHPESALWNDAWLYQARAQALAGDITGALATYRKLPEQRPDAKQAPTALWLAANLEAGQGEPLSAVPAYLALARRYPAADEGWRAYQTAALTHYQSGDIRGAGQIWSEMATAARMPAWTKAVAYYWLGQAQQATGEGEAARHSWQLATESDPESFYGMRAADRLRGAGGSLFGPGVTTLPTAANAAVDKEALAAWLRGWAGEGSLALSPAILADPDWKRGEQLLDIGLRSSAITAWSRLQKRFATNPWALGALSLAFSDAGEYPLSIAAAESLIALTPAGKARPVALERLAYPLPLMPLVQAEASKWSVDPLLVAAVIRQESRFETGATSTAAAQGLMQVIPDTAEWIATQLGRSNFQDHQIYWPYVNVEFGTYYLHRQLLAFDNVAVALAAYNGGPGNASKWIKRAPGDDDLMVALIDLPESRLYVQLVYQHYQAYRRLYSRQ